MSAMAAPNHRTSPLDHRKQSMVGNRTSARCLRGFARLCEVCHLSGPGSGPMWRLVDESFGVTRVEGRGERGDASPAPSPVHPAPALEAPGDRSGGHGDGRGGVLRLGPARAPIRHRRVRGHPGLAAGRDRARGRADRGLPNGPGGGARRAGRHRLLVALARSSPGHGPGQRDRGADRGRAPAEGQVPAVAAARQRRDRHYRAGRDAGLRRRRRGGRRQPAGVRIGLGGSRSGSVAGLVAGRLRRRAAGRHGDPGSGAQARDASDPGYGGVGAGAGRRGELRELRAAARRPRDRVSRPAGGVLARAPLSAGRRGTRCAGRGRTRGVADLAGQGRSSAAAPASSCCGRRHSSASGRSWACWSRRSAASARSRRPRWAGWPRASARWPRRKGRWRWPRSASARCSSMRPTRWSCSTPTAGSRWPTASQSACSATPVTS